LEELNILLDGLGIRVETGVFSNEAPLEYVVITPLSDTFQLFASNEPGYDQQEVRISIFTKQDKDKKISGNYIALKNKITEALLSADFTITNRQYIGHEDDTKYHHYMVDVLKIYPLREA